MKCFALCLFLCGLSLTAQAQSHIVKPSAFSWLEYTFQAKTNLQGRFRAAGGDGNDIEVYVMDVDGFENYRNGHNVKTYYNSGRATVGSFNLVLAPGRYCVVMSNTFSTFTNKVVTFSVLQATALETPAPQPAPRQTAAPQPEIEEGEANVVYEDENIMGIEGMVGDNTTGCEGPRTVRGPVASVLTQNEIVVGFKMQVGRTLATLYVDGLSTKDTLELPTIIKRGKRLEVSYYICGSGGHFTPDAIYAL